MALFAIAYFGGVLTILSPCILPVLPFVVARTDQPFRRGTLPTLAGMAAMFTVVATLAAVGGSWVADANHYGRLAALVLFALFGLALLFPTFGARLAQPLVRLGGRVAGAANVAERPVVSSLALGAATGLLWAPCAGPILGLVLTGAALQGASARTSLLLASYAAGAATSLALALVAGGRLVGAMRRSTHATEWLRRGLGAAVLCGVGAIALGLDTGLLTRLSLASTTALEQRVLDRFGSPTAAAASGPPAAGEAMSGSSAMAGPAMSGGAMTGGAMSGAMSGGAAMSGGQAMAGGAMMSAGARSDGPRLDREGRFPSLAGAVGWLNSEPLTNDGLKGQVVLIDFWTYSCINCLRAIPYVRAWAEKYRSQGLVVIGVHSPEFAFEKRLDNVKRAVADLSITYPVAIDNDYAIWRAFNNQYWPAHYFIDAQGTVRHHHFGEGGYEESELVIQKLLAEAGRAVPSSPAVSVMAAGAQAPSSEADVLSPETYIGYERAERFVSPDGAVKDVAHRYDDGGPRLNEWGLSGVWTIGREHATLTAQGGSVVYRFHARDLHLVLGVPQGARPVRFRVTLDGKPPGAHHGVDVSPAGEGVVTGQRLYQLIRQQGPIDDRTFEIRFLDPGVDVFAFTFG